MMETEVLLANHKDALARALAVLNQGGLIAFPTDTVYGVAALTSDVEAIQKLFEVKRRETGKAIAILIGNLDQLQLVTSSFNPSANRLAERFWPGPLTLVVSRHPSLPDILSPLPTIGVRMPDHAVAIELLNITGPLATTSANISGAANSNNAEEVMANLGGSIDLILDGGTTPGGVPSTVVDCTKEPVTVLRQGPISEYEIRRALAQ
jgi:L-threonylcarbamoyladenylate synthase